MLSKLIDAIVSLFKEKPYWSKVQPVIILVAIYLSTVALAYQFLDWRYQLSPPFTQYIRSYIFKEITVIFIAIMLVLLLFGIQNKLEKEQRNGRFTQFLRGFFRTSLKKLGIIGIVLALLIPILIYLSPSKASHIRIVFLDEPDFDKYAFLYIIYELNKFQKSWRFEVDIDVFDERTLSPIARKRCFSNRNTDLCVAQEVAKNRALIVFTTKRFDDDFFWQNEGQVSVISTFRWNDYYAPPSIYQYLAYSVIAQSINIHLNAQGKSLAGGNNVYYGDWLQFTPRRKAIRAEVLAAHLSPEGENLLLNCFGAEYMSICSKLLTLDWLRSERIAKNLEKNFHVKF